jgi:hypothetical protein
MSPAITVRVAEYFGIRLAFLFSFKLSTTLVPAQADQFHPSYPEKSFRGCVSVCTQHLYDDSIL